MATVGIRVNVIVPKYIFFLPGVQRDLQHLLTHTSGPEVRKEFEKTAQTWNEKPNWKLDYYFGQNVMWVKVFTYSTVYRLVNAGAAPHIIRPRHARVLRFQTRFRAKSRPRVIGAFAGGKSGNYISTLIVHHPGHEAREFDETIAEEYADKFYSDIQEAVSKGIAHA